MVRGLILWRLLTYAGVVNLRYMFSAEQWASLVAQEPGKNGPVKVSLLAAARVFLSANGTVPSDSPLLQLAVDGCATSLQPAAVMSGDPAWDNIWFKGITGRSWLAWHHNLMPYCSVRRQARLHGQ